MKTATELRQEQFDTFERASRYESLIGERVMLQAIIAKSPSSAAADAAIFSQIYDLVVKLSPEALTGRGGSALGFTVPDLMIARDVLRPIIAGAIERAQRITREEDEKRAKATARLQEVEEALKEFSE